MNEKIKSMKDNDIWDLVLLLEGAEQIGCKWILRKKLKPDCSIDKYKARLLVKGYNKKESIDYFETFSPITKFTSIIILFPIIPSR